jgi:hypothetical protein
MLIDHVLDEGQCVYERLMHISIHTAKFSSMAGPQVLTCGVVSVQAMKLRQARAELGN